MEHKIQADYRTPNRCDARGKANQLPSEIGKHMMTDTDKKSYKCDSFYSSNTLTRLMRKHTGEKLYTSSHVMFVDIHVIRKEI